jgi:tetratricopeptide (TPR) repeat protein
VRRRSAGAASSGRLARASAAKTAHGRGHHGHVVLTAKHSAPAKAQAAKAAEAAQSEPSDYLSENKIYGLYDQGLNARLLGDRHTAVSRLAQAVEISKETKLSPTMRAETQYELGRAAESDGEPRVAIEAFIHCLQESPRYTDASVRLASLLLHSGKPLQALMTARDATQRSPNDAKAHMILALVLENNGFANDARAERERANRLMNGEGRVPEPAPRNETVPGTQPTAPVPGEQAAEEGLIPGAFEPEGKNEITGPMMVPANGKIPQESGSGKDAPATGGEKPDQLAPQQVP